MWELFIQGSMLDLCVKGIKSIRRSAQDEDLSIPEIHNSKKFYLLHAFIGKQAPLHSV